MDNIMPIQELLRLAVERGASDLHLSVGYPPILRVNGLLTPLPMPPYTDEMLEREIMSLLTSEQQRKFKAKKDLDFAYMIPKLARFRVNVFYQFGGIGAAFRIIPSEIRTLEDLPAPEGVIELTKKRQGLILVTGPTGCGKSTTLAAMINRIDSERHAHIITIEDPIEYIFEGKNCLINQREIGTHAISFADALKSALREDPDVILVGEMRDLETISLALTAAETGHLVLSTLHTNNVAETVDRVINVFPGDQQNFIRSIFANVIEGIISQSLVISKDGQRRLAVMEVLIATPAIRNLIRENKSYQILSTVQMSTKEKMQTFDQALIDLYNRGLISYETVLENARDKTFVTESLKPKNTISVR